MCTYVYKNTHTRTHTHARTRTHRFSSLTDTHQSYQITQGPTPTDGNRIPVASKTFLSPLICTLHGTSNWAGRRHGAPRAKTLRSTTRIISIGVRPVRANTMLLSRVAQACPKVMTRLRSRVLQGLACTPALFRHRRQRGRRRRGELGRRRTMEWRRVGGSGMGGSV